MMVNLPTNMLKYLRPTHTFVFSPALQISLWVHVNEVINISAIILGMGSAKERRRYNEIISLIFVVGILCVYFQTNFTSLVSYDRFGASEVKVINFQTTNQHIEATIQQYIILGMYWSNQEFTTCIQIHVHVIPFVSGQFLGTLPEWNTDGWA